MPAACSGNQRIEHQGRLPNSDFQRIFMLQATHLHNHGGNLYENGGILYAVCSKYLWRTTLKSCALKF